MYFVSRNRTRGEFTNKFCKASKKFTLKSAKKNIKKYVNNYFYFKSGSNYLK